MNENDTTLVRCKPSVRSRIVHVRFGHRDEDDLARIKGLYKEHLGRSISTSVIVRRALGSLLADLTTMDEITKNAEKAALLDHVG